MCTKLVTSWKLLNTCTQTTIGICVDVGVTHTPCKYKRNMVYTIANQVKRVISLQKWNVRSERDLVNHL